MHFYRRSWVYSVYRYVHILSVHTYTWIKLEPQPKLHIQIAIYKHEIETHTHTFPMFINMRNTRIAWWGMGCCEWWGWGHKHQWAGHWFRLVTCLIIVQKLLKFCFFTCPSTRNSLVLYFVDILVIHFWLYLENCYSHLQRQELLYQNKILIIVSVIFSIRCNNIFIILYHRKDCYHNPSVSTNVATFSYVGNHHPDREGRNYLFTRRKPSTRAGWDVKGQDLNCCSLPTEDFTLTEGRSESNILQHRSPPCKRNYKNVILSQHFVSPLRNKRNSCAGVVVRLLASSFTRIFKAIAKRLLIIKKNSFTD